MTLSIGHSSPPDLTRLYTISHKLLNHQVALEVFLSNREQTLFDLNRSIVLYDLTNTYFEGQCNQNPKAQFGRSKEKRSDCPLVTLGLVLDGEGFPGSFENQVGKQFAFILEKSNLPVSK